MIQFQCPGCGKAFRVGDEKGGKTAKCPACGGMIQIPASPVQDLSGEMWDEIPADPLGPTGFPAPGPMGQQFPQQPFPQQPVANPFGDNAASWQNTMPQQAASVGAAIAGCCPSCRSPQHTKVRWTIWGGIIGPAMLSHVRCNQCSTTYNAKTGKSNNTAIAIYLGVSFAIGIGGAICCGLLGFLANF